jgi:hypothetical protein
MRWRIWLRSRPRERHLTYCGTLCGTHRNAHTSFSVMTLPVALFLSMIVRDIQCHIR